jgi:hypothetical protein
MEYPIPIVNPTGVKPIVASSKNQKIFSGLQKGDTFCIEGTYGTAMAFYSWLKAQVNSMYPIVNYESSRVNRDVFHRFAQRVLVQIVNHQINLQKAPELFWLREFYPKFDNFYLPFSEVLGINGAWQWFTKGIQFPGLEHKIFPFYGAYFPTRTEHLEMFDQWLLANKPIKNAVDIGTGCGVLSFYMLKHGVSTILATDINPNAIHSVNLEINRWDVRSQVHIANANLFSGINVAESNLVVFNPPWIPDVPSNMLDMAMYYQTNFFDNFFQQAFEVLPTGCRLVILFSTFGQAAGVCKDHPIDFEINNNNRFALVMKEERGVSQKPSPRKHWLDDIRQKEKIELWELRVRSS